MKMRAWAVVVEGVVDRHMLHLDLERDLMEEVHRNLTVVIHVMQIEVVHKS